MKRKLFGIIAGTMLLVVLGTGTAFADNPDRYNPAGNLYNHWGPLQPKPPLTEQPIPEPGKSNNYSFFDYQLHNTPGAPLPH